MGSTRTRNDAMLDPQGGARGHAASVEPHSGNPGGRDGAARQGFPRTGDGSRWPRGRQGLGHAISAPPRGRGIFSPPNPRRWANSVRVPSGPPDASNRARGQNPQFPKNSKWGFTRSIFLHRLSQKKNRDRNITDGRTYARTYARTPL